MGGSAAVAGGCKLTQQVVRVARAVEPGTPWLVAAANAWALEAVAPCEGVEVAAFAGAAGRRVRTCLRMLCLWGRYLAYACPRWSQERGWAVRHYYTAVGTLKVSEDDGGGGLEFDGGQGSGSEAGRGGGWWRGAAVVEGLTASGALSGEVRSTVKGKLAVEGGPSTQQRPVRAGRDGH